MERNELLAKAAYERVTKYLGSLIELSDLQRKKQRLEIEVKVEGNLTEDKFVQQRKILSSISVTPPPHFNLSNGSSIVSLSSNFN